ncbi:hypothetical protein CJ738_36810, partial [Klebsiella pneumoniae]
EQPARERTARHIWFKRKDGSVSERSLLLTGWLYSGEQPARERTARHIWFKRKDGSVSERSLLLTGWLY